MNQRTDSLQVEKSLTAPYSRVVLAGVLLLSLMSACMLYAFNSLGFEPPTAIYMFLAGGVATTLAALLVVATQRFHGRFTMDSDLSGVQKSHSTPVPRIGGVAVVAGLVVISLVDWRFGLGLPEAVHTEFSATLLGLLLCALPAAISGFVEDVTKKVSVKVRLLATIASGLLACVFIDAVIPKFDVWGLDALMAYSAFAMLATAFCAGGVANAVNIIDGFNGLAAGALVLIASGFALLGASVNDPTLVLLALSVAAVSAGFMVVNYPSGRLFLGDGGAYLLGFLVAELAILTAARHPELNAFTVLTLVSYPVLEVVVSVVRRKLRKASPGDPDRGHMHQQIQVALRHVFGRLAESQRTQQLRAHVPSVNAQVSPLVWVMVAGTVFTALVFKNAGAWVSLGFAFCTVLYVVVYRMVMAFNTQAERRRVVFSGSLEVKPLAEQGQVVEGVNKGEDAAQTQVAEKLRKTA